MRGSLHRELLEKWGAEVMARAVVLLKKVVSITNRAHYVNITCDNLVSIYRVEEERHGEAARGGCQCSGIREREELPPFAQGKGRHPSVSLSRSALSLPLPAARLPHPVQSPSLTAEAQLFLASPGGIGSGRTGEVKRMAAEDVP